MSTVTMPADWWRHWRSEWTLEMLELYLMSSAAAVDENLRAGEVLLSLSRLVDLSRRKKSTIQRWMRTLKESRGTGVAVRQMAGPTQEGTIYAVSLLRKRRTGTSGDARAEGPTGPAGGTPASPAKDRAAQDLDATPAGRPGDPPGPLSDEPDTDVRTAREGGMEGEVLVALRMAVLPPNVAGALRQFAAAGGTLEQLRTVIHRCGALAMKPAPASYLSTAILNEIRERPPSTWSPEDRKARPHRARYPTVEQVRGEPAPETAVAFPPADEGAADRWREMSSWIRQRVDEDEWQTFLSPAEGVGWDGSRGTKQNRVKTGGRAGSLTVRPFLLGEGRTSSSAGRSKSLTL